MLLCMMIIYDIYFSDNILQGMTIKDLSEFSYLCTTSVIFGSTLINTETEQIIREVSTYIYRKPIFKKLKK